MITPASQIAASHGNGRSGRGASRRPAGSAMGAVSEADTGGKIAPVGDVGVGVLNAKSQRGSTMESTGRTRMAAKAHVQVK
jgi:hypothetical protein